MYDADSELCNKLIEKYYDKCFILSKKENWIIKINLKCCLLKDMIVVSGHYKKWKWTDEEEMTDKEELTDVTPMPPLEGDEEEERKRKSLKILNPNKPLSRFPILLAQIKQLKIIKKWNQTNTISFVSS